MTDRRLDHEPFYDPNIAREAAELGPWVRRTVGELRAAVEAGEVAKTELQMYGLDWSQLTDEPDDAVLIDVFARRGAVPWAADVADEDGVGTGKVEP